MKLWHSLITCSFLMQLLLLLSAVHASALQPRRSRARSAVGARRARAAEAEESPLEMPPVHIRLSVSSPGSSSSSSSSSSKATPGRSRPKSDSGQWEETLELGEKYVMEESLSDDYEDVVDLIKVTISRMHRSSSSSDESSSTSDVNTRTRHRRAKKRGPSPQSRGPTGRKVKGGRGQGCVLKQIQLNVTDLGLGYRSSEEMIFRYCSGPCRKSETNYDKILSNLAHNKRLPSKDRPVQACCRPIAFDDNLSFLDDNLVYHTVRKHSARKCACV